MPTPDSRMLLVTVASSGLIRQIEEEHGRKLRDDGKMVLMDVDQEDIQMVDVEGDTFKIEVKVTPVRGEKL